MNANDALNNYFNSLQPKERVAKSRDIRSLCRISTCVLSDWRRGRTQIPWVFQSKITEALGKNIFDNVAN